MSLGHFDQTIYGEFGNFDQREFGSFHPNNEFGTFLPKYFMVICGTKENS